MKRRNILIWQSQVVYSFNYHTIHKLFNKIKMYEKEKAKHNLMFRR